LVEDEVETTIGCCWFKFLCFFFGDNHSGSCGEKESWRKVVGPYRWCWFCVYWLDKSLSCLSIFLMFIYFLFVFFLFPLSPTPFIVVMELVFIRDLRDAKAPVLAKSSLLITKPSSWPLILIMWICLSVHYTCMFWLVVQAVIFTCHARALVMLRQIKGGLHIKLSVRGIQGMVRVWERKEVWKVASRLAFYCLH